MTNRTVERGVFLALAVAVWSLLSLTGCVTETIGKTTPKAIPDEAADINLQLGVGYLRQNDLQSARIKLEKAVELNPDLVMAQTVLGLVYERLGDMEGAERHYRRAVSLAPNDPDALNSLAVFLCHGDDEREEAMEIFRRALAVSLSQTFSNKAMVNTNAGVCVKSTDLVQAEKYLRAALETDPDFPDALLQLADVAYKRGNFLQSRAFLQRYMAAVESTAPVLWLAMQVETAMGDVAAADEISRRLLLEFPESVEAQSLMEQKRNAGT
jgi:type IV pilus assembly protein PilF